MCLFQQRMRNGFLFQFLQKLPAIFNKTSLIEAEDGRQNNHCCRCHLFQLMCVSSSELSVDLLYGRCLFRRLWMRRVGSPFAALYSPMENFLALDCAPDMTFLVE